ncbi:MAG: AraC family transcriptional regulator [gamma proteobacterium symbiont of Taylorina sp.]|nr:AraC family transcriptional regulator [gamma proteobacterium symbiont of Taylorina sp.]
MTDSCLPPHIIYKILCSYNIDSIALFKNHGIKYQHNNQAISRVDCSKVAAVWQEAEQLIKDKSFGLKAGEYWHPSYMNALGYAWLASSSLYTAFYRMQRFSKIIASSLKINIIEDNDLFIIRLGIQYFAKNRPLVDALMSIIMTMCRTNYGNHLQPLRTTFQYQQPHNLNYYQAIFGSDILFHHAYNSIIFHIDTVKEPLLSGHAEYALFHEKAVIDYLKQMDEPTFVDKVKQQIATQLASGNVTAINIAESLFITTKQLQRKLKTEQLTFKILVDEVRENTACLYLKDPKLSLIEIAFMLGFSEVSSFSRAFKRYKSLSPKEYRIKNLTST